jgi:hypothetical protein
MAENTRFAAAMIAIGQSSKARLALFRQAGFILKPASL